MYQEWYFYRQWQLWSCSEDYLLRKKLEEETNPPDWGHELQRSLFFLHISCTWLDSCPLPSSTLHSFTDPAVRQLSRESQSAQAVSCDNSPACGVLLALIWEALAKGEGKELTGNQINWSVRPHSAQGPQLKCFCRVSSLGCWATTEFFTAQDSNVSVLTSSLLLFSLSVHGQLFKHAAPTEANRTLTLWGSYSKILRISGPSNLIPSHCPRASWNVSKEGSFQVRWQRWEAVIRCSTRYLCQRLTLQEGLPICRALEILLQVF